MKPMFAALLALSLISCVFEEPFETAAVIAVDPALTGLWQEVATDTELQSDRLLVLKNSENDYLVQYPVGEKTMFFRAFPIDLEGQRFIQLQLIGTEKGPVEETERRYHLLKARIDGGLLEVRTIDRHVLGEDAVRTQELREAFKRNKHDPKLFEKPVKFRRL